MKIFLVIPAKAGIQFKGVQLFASPGVLDCPVKPGNDNERSDRPGKAKEKSRALWARPFVTLERNRD
jgi:hypothetical protein